MAIKDALPREVLALPEVDLVLLMKGLRQPFRFDVGNGKFVVINGSMRRSIGLAGFRNGPSSVSFFSRIVFFPLR